MKKKLFAFCVACLCVLFGCSQGSAAQQASSSGSGSSSAAQEQSDVASGSDSESATQGQSDAASASSSTEDEINDIQAEGMPEYDFGFDEGEYLAKTYGLENVKRLDLVDSNQLAWFALNRVRVAVAVVDPESEKSKAMISEAQKGADAIGGTMMVRVYEPQRDAEDKNWDKLTKMLVDDGIANLEDISPERILLMNKQATDDNGSPAPVMSVITDTNDVQDTMKETFKLACCD